VGPCRAKTFVLRMSPGGSQSLSSNITVVTVNDRTALGSPRSYIMARKRRHGGRSKTQLIGDKKLKTIAVNTQLAASHFIFRWVREVSYEHGHYLLAVGQPLAAKHYTTNTQKRRPRDRRMPKKSGADARTFNRRPVDRGSTATDASGRTQHFGGFYFQVVFPSGLPA